MNYCFRCSAVIALLAVSAILPASEGVAGAVLDNISTLFPSLQQAAELAARGDADQARSVLRTIQSREPNSGPVYFELAKLEVQAGNPAAAEAVLDEGLAAAPNYAMLHFARARLFALLRSR
jgi:thioredoxin-like negative regulator of GroEL